MVKENLQKVQDLDLWSISPEMKGIYKAHFATMNLVACKSTDHMFRL